MAERILSGKIKQLVYTTEELSQSPLSTTVIDNGVLVYEKTSSGQIKCKMGDGNNVWSGLEYIEDSDKMDKTNPTGTGSFSMNRLEGSTIGSKSHAEGYDTTASGEASHAEGRGTIASGNRSHAEGSGTIASGSRSHAEGWDTIASGRHSHAEGEETEASGSNSHAEGDCSNATGDSSHAEGSYTEASGNNSHAEGEETVASGSNSHAEGYYNLSGGYTKFDAALGSETVDSTINYYIDVANLDTTLISTNDEIYVLVEDNASTEKQICKIIVSSITEYNTTGEVSTVKHKIYFDENELRNQMSGFPNIKIINIHVKNNNNPYSTHAEGKYTTASGDSSHAEGNGTTASGNYAHAEGYYTTASGEASHAEGSYTKAGGDYAHAEGCKTTASRYASHAEGEYTKASGNYAHAEGYHTTASSNSQHVQGKYNIEDTSSTYAHIVGGGTSNTNRKNIHTLDWNGNATFSGDVTATKSDGTEVSLLSLQNEVDIKIDDLAKLIVEYHPPKIMTVIIDKTDSNPETCITYADDAIGMTAGSDEWDSFFGHYPCLFKDGKEVGKLNPNNYAQFEDGTDANITSGDAGDVMIAFPKLGYKISSTDTTLTVSMTNGSNVEGYCYLAHTRGTTVKDKFYLGAYKGYVSDNKLRSLSGKTPTVSTTIGNFRTYAQANGSGYDQSAFNQLVFRQCMYLLKYKNLDSQTAVGQGYTSNNNYPSTSTGNTDTKGMDFGETTGRLQMKLFGLEDFWGNVYEWIDGIFSDSSYNILTATENFNNTGDGYTNQGSSGLSANTSGYIVDVQGTSEMGFVLKAKGSSSSTYYCDYGRLYASKLAIFGNNWNSGTSAGAFSLEMNYTTSSSSAIVSSRLMYL